MSDHILLQLALILLAAKLGGELFERLFKQPAVVGEILFGVLVGQNALGLVSGSSAVLAQLAEIGAVFLLFEVGLESDIDDLFQVGASALWVACAGVAFTLGLGYVAGISLGLQALPAIFVAAAMTATSVGITARVFSDLGTLQTREARIVLGAAVADDVIGLIIVSAVTGMALTRVVATAAILKLVAMAVIFLAGAVFIGLRATPLLLLGAKKMRTRAVMSTAAIITCLVLASIAEMAQLAPIIGAFAAGLVLAKTEHKVHFERQVKSIAEIFVPVFFVLMGARMNLSAVSVGSPSGRQTLAIAALLLVAVIAGKMLAGLSLPSRGAKRWTIGSGMIPRGEVTLISASIGLRAHVIGDALYTATILVVVLTTFLTPGLLKLTSRPDEMKGGHSSTGAQESSGAIDALTEGA